MILCRDQSQRPRAGGPRYIVNSKIKSNCSGQECPLHTTAVTFEASPS